MLSLIFQKQDRNYRLLAYTKVRENLLHVTFIIQLLFYKQLLQLLYNRF